MAALAYVLLPLSGLIAFLFSSEPRVRFHGAQAIAVGTVWAVLLYGSSEVSSVATMLVAGLGALLWAALFIGTAAGRDPRLPGVRRLLR